MKILRGRRPTLDDLPYLHSQGYNGCPSFYPVKQRLDIIRELLIKYRCDFDLIGRIMGDVSAQSIKYHLKKYTGWKANK